MATSTQKLVIVESPAKAKTIEKFLGRGYKVEASQGHVRDLPKSQLGVDADNDFEMKYITIRGRGKILAKIKREAKSASRIYLATDPDREGEAISWHLANTLEIDPAKPCRIEFHEITKKAVKEALEHPRPIDMDRVDAQQARRALDRLVGYKISPLLWAKVKKGLSAGRVQSVATRMVVEREQEIEAFIPEEFWDITAQFAAQNQKGRKMTCQAKLISLNGKKASIHNEKEALAAKQRILKGSFSIQSIKRGDKLKRPQPPFTTSSLQQEASRKLNFSTAKTMQVVQQLYEGIDLGKAGTVGLVTYIRTDSVRVAEEAVQAARGFITSQFGEDYCPEQPNQYKGRKNAQDALGRIFAEARAKGVRVQFADEKALDRESETGRHQGVIAYATDFVYADFDELLAPADTPRLVIVCDGIEDVHNLGSILRVAECVGASGVVIPKNKSAQVNESVMRISEGAANHIKIARVPGVNYAVDELKKNGYWVYALEAAGEDIYAADLTGDVALVIGGEDSGVGALTQKKCDKLVSLPMFGKINSLNASVALGVAAYEVVRQRKCPTKN